MRPLALLLPLALAACTLNVDAVSEERTAFAPAEGWDTFRAHVDDLPEGLHVRGADVGHAEVTASLFALVADDDERVLDRAWLGLAARGSVLELAFGADDDACERVSFEWIDAILPADRDVDLESVHGDLRAQGLDGRIRARSFDGDVVAHTTGTLDVRTDHGDVDASGSGGRIEVEDGDVTATVLAAGPGGMRIEAEDGDVRVRVPRGLGLELDVESEHGEVEVRVGGVRVTHGSHFHGRIGEGGYVLSIATEHGNVTVTD